MFCIIAGILVFLWLMGLVISYTMEEISRTAGGRPHRVAHRVAEGQQPIDEEVR